MGIYQHVVSAWPRRPLDRHLALVFGMAAVAAMLATLFYVYGETAGLLQRAAGVQFERDVAASQAWVDKELNDADTFLQLLSSNPMAASLDTASQDAFVAQLKLALDSSPFMSAIYIGFDDGGFVLLRQLTSLPARRILGAPDEARYLFDVIHRGPGGETSRRQELLDAGLRDIGPPARAPTPYDPRVRPFYTAAYGTDSSILTAPYLFAATQELGLSVARRLKGGAGVMSADLAMADLSQALARMRSTPSSEAAIVNDRGDVIAASDAWLAAGAPPGSPAPPLAATMLSKARQLDPATTHPARVVQVQGRDWVMHAVPLRAGRWMFRMVMATPRDEMLAGARDMIKHLLWVGAALVCVAILVFRMAARWVSRPLVELARQADDIRAFRFRDEPVVHSSVVEIDALAQSLAKASSTISRFIEIGSAFAAERDPEHLMRRLLRETINITEAEGGMLLLTEDDGRTWSRVVQNSSGDAGPDAAAAVPPLDDSVVEERVRQALRQRDVSSFDLRRAEPAPLSGSVPAAMNRVFRYTVFPLCNRSDEVIGGLVLAGSAAGNATTPQGRLSLASALAGTAAAAIETTLLLKSRKALLDSVIRTMAQAIDAKSLHTGGHCQRVPVLTEALARAACEADSGPFADFSLTPADWEAVEVAGWLHDWGKLTTAEYVIDKGTKLEAVYNRIHEIRMRFELLKCQAHVDYWRGLAEGADEAALRAARDEELARLDEDYAFVARCNEGGEAMAPEDLDHLRRIGARTWLRTLDDRLGISREENLRRQPMSVAALPAREPLLSDRPDHLVPHPPSAFSDAEAQAGFRMQRPAYHLNLGELYNLSVGRGTLTPEERYEVNRHITHTIVMLEKLPLTGALQQVPEFAGGHHEKMDGTGYPRGLKREEMSVVARIMAIADVFEALTSADRPYKKAKPLSEAIGIMGRMKRERHLDPDLLDLFLTSGVWRGYARRFLQPEQIDEPDIETVLDARPEAA
jgi:HD-GYP domain-containing protein (c-di-GMP phosphodiesterase class II)/HAMP domain-containing protein